MHKQFKYVKDSLFSFGKQKVFMEENLNKYYNAKIHDWWRSKDFNEFISLIEHNGELRLIIRKIPESNGKL